MAEHMPVSSINPNPEIPRPSAAHVAFFNQLHAQSAHVPEIADKAPAIEAMGRAIIDAYDIQPTLFEDGAATIMFAAIADRWASPQTADPSKPEPAEQTFLKNALTLLAYRHSPVLAHAEFEIEKKSGSAQIAHELAVYDKYTHESLTKTMRQKIAEGLLDDVKQRLGITEANEDPYDLRVLSIDPGGSNAYGIIAPLTPWDKIPGDHHDKVRVNNSEYATQQLLQAHKKDLRKRSEQMAAELGLEEMYGKAWVTWLGEDRRATLCIGMPLAEKFISPELTENASYYDDDARAIDMATLKHEYVHTQGGLNLNQGVSYGINFEEKRADFFSGSEIYEEVEAFFVDLWTISGFYLTNELKGKAKGGTAPAIYAAVANNLGLQGGLEIALTMPQCYIDAQPNQYQKAVADYIGGFDGVTGRLLAREIDKGNQARIEHRVEIIARGVARLNQKQAGLGDEVLVNRRDFSLNVMTDLVAEKVVTLKLAA